MSQLRIHEGLTIPETELEESFSRSGGPGGQHVNKVSSKVTLRWNVADSPSLGDDDRRWLLQVLAHRLTEAGEVIIVSNTHREQSRNRDDARDKLAMLIRSSLMRPTVRKKTRISRAAHERRLHNKRHRSAVKKSRGEPEE